MNVKLVSITQPQVEGVNSPEDLVVYCARVSNPNNQLNMETAPKLLSYLIREKHWSPFEMVDMAVEIKTSRAIAAQILRHRSFSFQEFSQRYSEVTEFEPIELRKQGATNRQVGDEPFEPDFYEAYIDTEDGGCYSRKIKASKAIKKLIYECNSLYQKLIDAGVAKECARMVLPLSTQTTLYMKGSLRSWTHYLGSRCDEKTQKEHRDVANAIRTIFIENFPNISNAIGFNGTTTS